MKNTEIFFCGKKLRLYLSMEAYLEICQQEEDGVRGIYEKMAGGQADGLRACCYAATVMSRAGARVAAALGLEPSEAIEEEKLYSLITPATYPLLAQAVMEALQEGLLREKPEEEVDLGLAELEKKTK